MVVEDEDGIVGYAVAALNIKSYNQKMAVSWIPELQAKYPLEEITNDVSSSVQVRSEFFCFRHPSVPQAQFTINVMLVS